MLMYFSPKHFKLCTMTVTKLSLLELFLSGLLTTEPTTKEAFWLLRYTRTSLSRAGDLSTTQLWKLRECVFLDNNVTFSTRRRAVCLKLYKIAGRNMPSLSLKVGRTTAYSGPTRLNSDHNILPPA